MVLVDTSTMVTALVAVGLLITVLGLRRRAAQAANEPRTWSLMLLGVASISGSVLVGKGVDAVAPDGGAFVRSVGCVLACATFYEALTTWNRRRIVVIERGETLNGLSAAMVGVALANLIAGHFRHPGPGLPQWQLQASLWVVSALIVVLGTALTIARISGLLRDPRIWLVTIAIGAAAGTELTGLTMHGPTWRPIEAVWLSVAALIVLSVMLAPRPGSTPSVAAAEQATIFGALTVLFVAIAILTVDNDFAADSSRWPTLYAVAGGIGASVRVVRLVRDLSSLAQSRREALTDELTGIANRRALLAAIDEALLTVGSTTLLIIDLDRFKAINDRYGHAAGDQVLRHMATTFEALIPARGLLARLGGDEFAVLLTDAEPGMPSALARSLAQAAAPLSDVKGQLLQVGASVGVATVESPGVLGGELLRQADAAMYQAKTSGSGVSLYDGVVDAVAQERLELVEDLHQALAGPDEQRDQIVVYFQPQLDARTGRVMGAEALVRWQHPRLGLLAPDLFIDLAEQNELMASLTDRVMREAARQAARWRAGGHRLRVSVNLSASCLSHDSLLPLLDDVLETGLTARDLVLEVTETSLMKDPELALAAMRQIADRGVGISIDDYGTGYSSLSYLNHLPATELKIDRSFTARITNDPRTAAIVAGTVELAHHLGMRLIAEGVEDNETLTEMIRLGCDETQGYLHSRPLPAEMFLEWLRSHSAHPVSPASAVTVPVRPKASVVVR